MREATESIERTHEVTMSEMNGPRLEGGESAGDVPPRQVRLGILNFLHARCIELTRHSL